MTPMLDELDADLAAWFHRQLPEVAVVIGESSSGTSEPAVCLLLLDLSHARKPQVDRAPVFEICARYLVMVIAPTVADHHRILGKLLLAALSRRESESPKFEVQVEAAPLELWEKLKLSPQPAFFINCPLRFTLPVAQAKPVEEVAMTHVLMRPLKGVVMGRFTRRDGEKRAVPLAEARVEVLGTQLSARTAPNGEFRFAAVPVGKEMNLRVMARGRTKKVTLPAEAPAGEVLRLDLDMDVEDMDHA